MSNQIYRQIKVKECLTGISFGVRKPNKSQLKSGTEDQKNQRRRRKFQGFQLVHDRYFRFTDYFPILSI